MDMRQPPMDTIETAHVLAVDDDTERGAGYVFVTGVETVH
jgi:hypothetical protein